MKSRYLIASVAAALAMHAQAQAHCEIPCGIYGDEARFTEIAEHIQTIEKSMDEIKRLGANPGGNANQLIRWVNNKETHADKIQHIVTQYFMTQRIKPDQPDYEARLKLLHGMLLKAMKSKQTTDTANTQALSALLEEFRGVYFGEPKATEAAHDDHAGHDHGSHAKGSMKK
ncbi:MAG: superoxide dismutase [Ni] [Verrucomicrobia bacterium]|nr:superoxide dismutase [Ni] [Verrucomicrobiota bacterium]